MSRIESSKDVDVDGNEGQLLLTGMTERGQEDALYEDQLGSVVNSVSTLKDNNNVQPYEVHMAEPSVDTDYDQMRYSTAVGGALGTAANLKSEESTMGTRDRDRILDSKNITQERFL